MSSLRSARGQGASEGTPSAATFLVPDPAPFRDALIGATAAVHGMAVVTRNEKDFVRLGGVDVVNPWR